VRTWPALEVSRLTRAGADTSDLLQAALVDHKVAAISEVTPDTWHVFFETSAARDTAATELSAVFQSLSIARIDVDDEDWVARSQAGLRAVQIGRIIVTPSWDRPASPQPAPQPSRNAVGDTTEAIVIVIRPSMGFGTGHHATTRLCLAALQSLPLHGRAVVDVGTGSGVLAIAASRLGAADVLGIDDDPDALQAASDNLDLNPGAVVTLREQDARAASAGAFAVVTANLTGALLAAIASQLIELAAPGGMLVLSGLLEPEESAVRAAFGGCLVHNRAQEEEWVCLTLARP
jgi:ribosomal protein L11 methyltransferase